MNLLDSIQKFLSETGVAQLFANGWVDAVKTLGAFPAEIRLMENVTAKITFVVEGL